MDMNVKDALPCGYMLNGKNIKYRVDEVLGQGTFGIVYKCSVMNEEGTESVAIKEFFLKEINGRYDNGYVKGTELPLFKKYLKSFIKETEHLSGITHENIVQVQDVFAANDTYYMVMEYLSGGSLNGRIKKEERLSEKDSLNVAEQCCRALEHIHEHHMLHLDVKPLNIVMNEQDKPKLVDFGLSKVFDENGKPETESPIGLGTPSYAPLEQVVYNSTKEFSPTLDVYAMGASMFHMLTGLVPPTAINVLNSEGIIGRILQKSGVGTECTFLVERAMEPVIARRTPNMTEMVKEIQMVQNLLENVSHPSPVKSVEDYPVELHGFACHVSPSVPKGLLYLLEEMLAYMKGHAIPDTNVYYHPYSMYYLNLLCKPNDCTFLITIGHDTAPLTEWLMAIQRFNQKTGMEMRLATTVEMERLFSDNGNDSISFGHCLAYDAVSGKYRIYDCRNKCVPEMEISATGSYHAVVVCEMKKTC